MLFIGCGKTAADNLIWCKLTWEADYFYILKTVIAKRRMPAFLTTSCHSVGIANHTVKLLAPALRTRPLIYTIASLICHFRRVQINPISAICLRCFMQHKFHKTGSIFAHVYQEMTFTQLFYGLCYESFLDLNWRTLACHQHSCWRLHLFCSAPAVFLGWLFFRFSQFFC